MLGSRGEAIPISVASPTIRALVLAYPGSGYGEGMSAPLPPASPLGTRRRIRELTHDSLVFDVVDEGPLDGPAVVLLHGFPERASHWHDVGTVLHSHGLRTLAPDQRGYSPRARPTGR